MAHDVFISYSYSAPDTAVADAVCATLETKGIKCWIAPRDVTPLKLWVEAIVDALDESQILVLVLSSASNNSPQVLREVGKAASRGIPIAALRIENIRLSKAMEFFIAPHQWLDAQTPPIQEHLEKLALVVQQFLANGFRTSVEDEILSRLRKEMFTANSSRELQRIIYRLEDYLAKYPHSTDAQLLKNEVKAAIRRTESLKIAENALGPDHPDVAAYLNNLAGLYHTQGKYEQALPLYQRALKIDEKALGPDHPDVARDLNNLALLYHAQGKYEQALPLYQQALKINERALGPDCPSVATQLNSLAALYDAQGRYEEALPLYQRVLKIDEKALGPDHPFVARDLNNLALLYHAQGKYEEALPLYQRALKIDEKALGPDHPDVARDLNNLAVLYREQRRYEQALPLYQRALKIDEKALGPDHPFVATYLNSLAELYRAQGRYEQALPLYQRALKISERTQGANHPSTIIFSDNLKACEEAIQKR